MYSDEQWLKQKFLVERLSSSQIASMFGVSRKRVEYYIKKFGFTKRFKHSVNERKFDLKDPIFCYYVGLIASDGYVDKNNPRVSLRMDEHEVRELFEKLKAHFEFTGELRRYNFRDNGKNSLDLTISSEMLIKVLAQMNVIPTKSLVIEFPKKFHSQDCLRMFIRGLIDGDGSIRKRNQRSWGNVRYFIGSEPFVVSLIEVIEKQLGFCADLKWVTRRKEYKYPGISLTREQSLLFLYWIYTGYEDFRLNKKYEIYQECRG